MDGMMKWFAGGPRDIDPVATWVDGLANAFTRLDFARVTDGPFAGDIEQAASGDIRISRVTASPHRVIRRAEHIKGARGDRVFVNLQISGIGQTLQGERRLRTGPMDIAIADTLRPFEIEHRDRFSLFSVEVPRRLVPAELLREGRLALSASRWGREIAKLMMGQASLATDPRAKPEAVALLSRHVVDLLGVGLDEMRGPESGVRSREVKAELIESHIERNFRDPCLSAAATARAFSISERYVHKVFAARGIAFSERVNEMRLEECARALAEPRAAKRFVANVAQDAGFSDVSHFNRLFKAKFGETPTAYRVRLRGQ